ncbi:MAG: type IX secretion system protein PorQ [Marinilabiliaceae bacterium]|nr:type IX secretion system protein PorQ [Marinilabiliaceae bacterium]
MTTKQLTHILTFVGLWLMATSAWAQQGGASSFDFLTIPHSAKMAAMGGNPVGYYDHDLNHTFHNPAILTDSMSHQVVLNFVPYMAGIKYGFTSYALHVPRAGMFAIGIQNINYGSMTRTDEYDNTLGNFSAAEYALLLTYARQLTPTIRAGIAFKPIYSHLDQYTSMALAADVGIIYHTKNDLTSIGLTFKNFGSQITTYETTTEKLPTDLQVGFSTKLAHAPFRFSITWDGLLNWDLEYTADDSQNGSATSNNHTESISFGANILRHTTLGVEFAPSRNFFLAGGYHFRRRAELGLDEKMSTVGLSWGVGFRVSKFRFAYGSARYHLAGTTNHFSLTTNLSELF